jgi:hypothetical protein
MELAFLFILFGIVFGIATIMNGYKNNTRLKCHDLGVGHVWVTKGDGENTYLVCEKCKSLPGGGTEEGNGNYDF